ncbi:MAG: hypothetical protein V4736_02350 [Bdellovibrionota bacterium]
MKFILPLHTLFIFVAVLGLTLPSMVSKAGSPTSHQLCAGIIEPNNMQIPSTRETGITFDQYNQVLDRIFALYSEEIKALGGNLIIKREWDNPAVNAMATHVGGEWALHMYGGMARYPIMTADAFAVVTCHEMGHHMGGAPLKPRSTWASLEGQADYYATLKCLRRFFALDDNQTISASPNVTPFIRGACEKEFSDVTDQQICMRSSVASIVMAEIFKEMRKETTKILDITKPNPKKVWFMDIAHPETQCRLDTYFNGAICNAPLLSELSYVSYKPGTCDRTKEFGIGSRPRCWFRPF